MRNINIVKTANIISIVLMFVLAFTPFLASAQFGIVDCGNTGVPCQSTFSGIVMQIIQILLSIAGLVAVIFLIVGGFRYITAGGNEETAEAAKKTITNAIIGIVVIILSFVIVRVISNALTKNQA